MTLRLKYTLFVVFLHLVILLLTFKLLSENKVLFIASEAFLLASLFFSFRLYRSFIEPLRVLLAGVEAIRSQDFTVKFRKVGQKELDQLIQVYNDMIDHLRKERTQLAEQHFFLEKLLHALPIAVILMDYDERISDMNPEAGALFGVGNQPVQGLRIRELPHPLAPLLDAIPEGGIQAIQVNGVERYKVQRSFFMDRGFKRHFLLVEELTAEMLETEKRSYGKVIRMMAHEVNNSIGPVNSILDSTTRHLQTLAMEDGRFVEALEIAMARNERLNQFMRRFADVVRLPAPLYEKKSVGELIGSLSAMFSIMARERGVALSVQIEEAEIVKKLDPSQVEQAVLNILKNALDACQAGDQIRIVVSARQLQVRNNGAPIPESVVQHLFTPFFSTKPDGQGIGLTLTREILLQHGWKFALETQSDGWTEFRIWW